METVLTAILVSIILNTATGSRSIGHNAAIAVGSTVALLGLFASPISGASMNPARSLGPDIVSTNFTGWWVYIAGPVIGAGIAVMIIGLVRGLPNKDERDAAEGGALPILGRASPATAAVQSIRPGTPVRPARPGGAARFTGLPRSPAASPPARSGAGRETPSASNSCGSWPTLISR